MFHYIPSYKAQIEHIESLELLAHYSSSTSDRNSTLAFGYMIRIINFYCKTLLIHSFFFIEKTPGSLGELRVAVGVK